MHKTATRSQLKAILAFSALYLFLAAMFSLKSGNKEFIFYILVIAVQLSVLIAVHFRVGFSAGLLWCLSLWGLLHMAGGLIPIPDSWDDRYGSGVLYNFWLIPERVKYDQIIHAFGFGVTTWLCWQALSTVSPYRDGRGLTPSPGLMVLCAAAGMGFGALNEVVEFIATLTLPETNVGGYENTGWDLVANLVGATIAALLISFFGKSPFSGEKTPSSK
ncbi:MAG: DUF2238 domain-containing protein [Verrucomicrobiales bacterium]|jgi:uncharacterized membrane protein YjdF|nr:DUF2238 domain-containing protein [Verrucomicrobiales bacterium]HQZ26891.1 DUF2238 domain-containing protein [Verrucomicrobiales bacterium]